MTDGSFLGAARRFLRRGALGLLVLAAAAVSGALAGEEGEKEEEFDPRVYLEVEDEASGMIRAAWRAREVGNWRKAIEKYLEVARKYGHTVFPQTERLYLPMSALIRRELASLPKEGRELYKVLKLGEAEMACRRAVELGSRAQLERIPASYPCLAPAPRALYLLGEWSRAGGQAGRAIYYWQRLMSEYPDWDGASRAALLARSAMVALEAGRRAESQRLLGALKRTSGLARLRVGGREVLVADEIERRLAEGGSADAARRGADSGYWPSMGGGSAHDRAVGRVVDAGVRRWHMELAVAPAAPKGRRVYGQPAHVPSTMPRRHPVSAAGYLFLAGDNDVVALRAMSGQVGWRGAKGRPSETLPVSRQTLPAVGDGKVFVALGSPQSVNRYGVRRTAAAFRSNVTLRAYALVGGKLKWESGAREDAKTKEFLSSVEMVAAPVYAAGYVFCPAVKRGSVNDAHMLCFDAGDGRLVWRAFICAGKPLQTGYYYNASTITEDALPPAVSQGLVAFVTNLGAVAVCDAASGELLWIYLYDRIEPSSTTDRFGRPTGTKVDRWAASAPIIRDGVLYAAPQDCRDLLALDLTTGRVRWKSHRGKLKHLVGIQGDCLLCSGEREVVAFSARTGKRLWRGLLSDQEAGLGLVGKAVASTPEGFAMIPTKAGIQRFDLKTGKLKSSYRFKGQPGEQGGNLVITRGVADSFVLACVGKSSVGGYFAWQETVEGLRKQIAAQPAAAGPLADMGEIHFLGEKYRQASDFFKQALTRVKPGERVGSSGVMLEVTLKKQIWESHSRLGKSAEKEGKFAGALEDYREAHKYAQSGAEKMTGHMRFARCRRGLEEWPAAVAEYQTIISRFPKETHSSSSGRVMAGRFAKAQVEHLIDEKGREVYARFDAEARERLERARGGRDAALAAKIIENYPNSAAVSPALILLSELHTAAGEHADAAARLREHLWKQPKSPREIEVRARLALCYQAQGMKALSRSMLRRMERAWAEKTFELGGRSWTVKAFATAHMPEGKEAGGLQPRPTLGPSLAAAWKAGLGGEVVLIPKASMHDLTGTAFLRLSGRGVAAVGLTTGKVIWKKSDLSQFGTNRYLANSLAGSGVVAVASGKKLIGLAPATGQAIWEAEILKGPAAGQRLYNQFCRLAVGEGVVAAAPSWMSRDMRTGRHQYRSNLTVLDQGTGRQVWSAKPQTSSISALLMAEGTLYVASFDRQKRRGSVDAYEVADGSKRFSAALSGAMPGQLAVRSGLLVALSHNTIACYDAATGKLKWRNSTGATNSYLLAADDSRVVVGGYFYVGRVQSVKVSAWDMETGKKLWSSPALKGYMRLVDYRFTRLGYVLRPAESADRVAISYMNRGTRRYYVAVYDGVSGKMLWRSELPVNSVPGPVLVGRGHAATTVYNRAGSERRIWDLESGKLVERKKCGLGYLTVQEGAVLQVGSSVLEKLTPPPGGGGGRKK